MVGWYVRRVGRVGEKYGCLWISLTWVNVVPGGRV